MYVTANALPEYDTMPLELILNAKVTRDQAHSASLEDFFSKQRERALVHAQVRLQQMDDALDAVQDAMLNFCRKYSNRPTEEWAPLFYRMVENATLDRLRKRQWERFKFWSTDTIDYAPTQLQSSDKIDVSDEFRAILFAALRQLPDRQRQAFLFRHWHGLSSRQTSIAMQVSEGSVKTHLSRAMRALRPQLSDVYEKLDEY